MAESPQHHYFSFVKTLKTTGCIIWFIIKSLTPSHKPPMSVWVYNFEVHKEIFIVNLKFQKNFVCLLFKNIRELRHPVHSSVPSNFISVNQTDKLVSGGNIEIFGPFYKWFSKQFQFFSTTKFF